MRKPTKKPTTSAGEVPMIHPDELIHPYVLKHAKNLRAGKGIAFDQKFAVPYTWNAEELERIHNGIREWLKHGDFQILAKLLQDEPRRVSHTVIMLQLNRLKSLTHALEKTDTDLEFYIDEEVNGPLFPQGTRQAARNALLTIFQGMWNAFSPGTLFVKQRKKRGPPRDWQDWEIEGFLEDDYNPLMEHLEHLELETDDLSRVHGESQTAYLNKLTQVVRQLDALTAHSWKSVKTKSGDSVIKRGVIPLRIARLIARQAIPKNRVQKHKLVTGLFAHYWGNDHTKWKRLHRIIERGEEKFRHLHRRKPRH